MNAGNKNTPSTHHPRRRNVTTLMVGLKKKTVTYAKISPKSGEPRDIAGERKKEKKKKSVYAVVVCVDLNMCMNMNVHVHECIYVYNAFVYAI